MTFLCIDANILLSKDNIIKEYKIPYRKDGNMKRNTIRKISISLTLLLFVANLLQPLSVNAQPNQEVYLETFAEEYQLNVDEVENLSENIEIAMDKLPELQVGDTVTIPISENLFLEASLNASVTNLPTLASAYEATACATMELKNVLNMTILVLESYGVFYVDGTYSVPRDAYTSYVAFVWQITKTESKLGSPAVNGSSYVRNTFNGELNIGIDPVSMTILSFSRNNVINYHSNGSYTTTWN